MIKKRLLGFSVAAVALLFVAYSGYEHVVEKRELEQREVALQEEAAREKAAKEKAAREKAAIEHVLAEDERLTETILGNPNLLDKYWSGAKITLEYADAIDSISLEGCPTDFKHAFKTHVNAWLNAGKTVAHVDGWNAFLKGFLSGGTNVIADAEKLENADKEISDTWLEVQKIAIDYGVDP